MSVSVRKIESATVVFCVFQLLLVLLGGAGYALLAYRVNHFDYGKLQIDEGKIIDAVQRATREFLQFTSTNNTDNAVVKKPSVDLQECEGIIYQTVRRRSARIGHADYSEGDYIKQGTNLYEIVVLDFDRQRLYAVNEFGDKLILCMVGLPISQKEDFPGDRRPASIRDREGERDDERRVKGSPFS